MYTLDIISITWKDGKEFELKAIEEIEDLRLPSHAHSLSKLVDRITPVI